MSTDMDPGRTGALLGNIGITRKQARDASLCLAGHASGRDELRLWLEICGLLPYESGGYLTDVGRRGMAKREAT